MLTNTDSATSYIMDILATTWKLDNVQLGMSSELPDCSKTISCFLYEEATTTNNHLDI
ncbi:MAG: hypothetical protein QS721_11570 [Candidatus Endonucleobacter sp. (ex Gigantidas childressi)]|nr:hypothetical protein [Candidatus Endonucleobacter sp. (ex Gigantidas childressi)]